MPAPVTPSAAPAGSAPDAKTTAQNLVNNMQSRAGGKAPAAGSEKPGEPGAASEAAADPNAGKKKYVVNGQERWLSSEQADAYVQKGLAFEPRISELARLQKETASFLQTLKDSPEKVLFDKRIGLTPEAVLERILGSSKVSDAMKETTGKWYFENVVKLAKMDPKDRELHERDAKIKEFEDEKKRTQEESIARENQQRVQAALAQVKSQIAEAMKEIGLPSVDTPVGVQLAKRVADVMRLSYLARKACTPKEAAAKVRSEISAYQRSFYDALDEDKIVAELGKENAEKVRKYFLKIVKETERAEKNAGAAPIKRRGDREIVTPDQMHDYLAEVKRNNKV